MSRFGKIARLPLDIREQLNRRLQDGEIGKELVIWLNSVPEVQTVLKAEFGDRPVNEPNLSDWRTGGCFKNTSRSRWRSRDGASVSLRCSFSISIISS